MQKPSGVTDGPYPGEYTESKMTALKEVMLSQSPNGREMLKNKTAKKKKNLVSQSLDVTRVAPKYGARKLPTEPDMFEDPFRIDKDNPAI